MSTRRVISLAIPASLQWWRRALRRPFGYVRSTVNKSNGWGIAAAAAAAVAAVLLCDASVERDSDVFRLQLKDVYLGIKASCEQHNEPFGSVPTNEDNIALYSWRLRVRVALYPRAIFRTFAPTLPWYHEKHRQIREEPTSSIFGYGVSRTAQVVAIKGNDTAFKSGLDFKDIPPDTLLLIEWRNSSHLWYEDGDLPLALLESHSSEQAGSALGAGNFFVVFADGESWELADTIPIATLLPLCRLERNTRTDRRKQLTRWRIE